MPLRINYIYRFHHHGFHTMYIYLTSNASIMALRSNEIPDFFLVDWFWAGTLRIPGCGLTVLPGPALGWMTGLGRAGAGWPRDLVLRLSSCNICCSRLISASSSSAACCTNSNFFLRRREFRTKVWSPAGSARASEMKGHFGELALFSR